MERSLLRELINNGGEKITMTNFPIFNFLDELTYKGYIKDTLIQLKSKKDIDITVSTDVDKIVLVRGIIEANLYTRRELNVKSVKQYGKDIMMLTNKDETIKIVIVDNNKIKELKKELVEY